MVCTHLFAVLYTELVDECIYLIKLVFNELIITEDVDQLMLHHTCAAEKYSDCCTKRRISSVNVARSQLVMLIIHSLIGQISVVICMQLVLHKFCISAWFTYLTFNQCGEWSIVLLTAVFSL